MTLPLKSRGDLDTSEGTDVVKNFAFIATLLKMAKDHSHTSEDDVASEALPIVMDAPFSKVDSKHIQNISKEISKLSQQSVVTMMELQWKNASKTMGDHVGAKYTLVQHTQTHTEIVRD